MVSQLHAVKYLGNPLNLLSGTWPSLVGHGVLNDMDTHVKQFFSGVFEHDRAFEGACEKKANTANQSERSIDNRPLVGFYKKTIALFVFR